MKIFYDYQALAMQRFGGISRYYYELIKELNKIEGVETDISCVFSQNEYFKNYPNVFTVKPYHWRVVQIVNKLNNILAVNRVRKNDYDIVHPTYYDPFLLNEKKGRKVVTIHDMIQEVFPEYYCNDHTIERKKACIYRSDHIVAISESTKRDILRIYPDVNPEKISVIYHGSTKLNPEGKKSLIKLPGKFVLFVGNRFTYKNFRRFFEAMCPIMDNSNIHIVCAGGGAFTKEENRFIGKYSERIHQYFMNDADLEKAYNQSICFVFPSLYEGFGLPVLEAFQCGCPVIMSNTSSLPEVGGEAADYFDPMDEKSIRNAITKVVDNVDFYKSEVINRRHLAQMDKFTWIDAARKTKDCYERIIQEV